MAEPAGAGQAAAGANPAGAGGPGEAPAEPQPDAEAAPLPVLNPVNGEYEKIHRVGEGTYGVVYKARHIPTGRIVALKKVRFERSREGVPVTSVRELRVLQECRHPNIVHLERVVTGSKADSVFLVFEYAEHDLGRLLDAMPTPFTESEVKCLVRQLLSAVAFLHQNAVLHRDIKLSNLLYTAQGDLKLCDFGLARHARPPGAPLTPRVVTLWYRAPELLLGADEYSEAVDCWAVGCVLGELLKHEPLFPAQGERECLDMQCRLLGTPSPRIWPGMVDLPGALDARLHQQPYNNLRRAFPGIGEAGLSLLNGLLTYDPARRLTARGALAHPYFREKPFPKQARDMPTFPSSHEPGFKGVLTRQRGGGRQPYESPPEPQPPRAAQHASEQQQQQQGWQRRADPALRARGADSNGGRWGEVFGGDRGSGGARDAKRTRLGG
ncbi:cell division cycle 2 [Raphidocelis subcapitata]|uniref:cyclin-dependent kinase n=1 Tax=Raphidocelis subcapitata TaxID=307507 RepID=A0A2V0P5J8_9CHLO|nr:cell division cycle 2 [Raphidocelis subcapitata]|eukprot:GBF94202.1 cell division cycle 2 [Raphidocelis subcapitata]